MTETKPPRRGAMWVFLLATFAGGLLVAVALVMMGLSAAAGLLSVVWPAGMAFLLAGRRGVSWSAWGLTVFDRRVLYGAALAVVVVAAATVIRLMAGEAVFSGDSADSGLTVMAVLIGFPVFFLLGTLIEIPWRGFLLTELAKRGMASAIVWSSLAAAVWMIPGSLRGVRGGGGIHVILTLISLTAFQVVAAVLRIRTGSVYAPAAFYGLWMSIALRGQVEYNPASATMSAVLLVLAAALLLRFWLRRSDTWPSSIQQPSEPVIP